MIPGSSESCVALRDDGAVDWESKESRGCSQAVVSFSGFLLSVVSRHCSCKDGKREKQHNGRPQEQTCFKQFNY